MLEDKSANSNITPLDNLMLALYTSAHTVVGKDNDTIIDLVTTGFILNDDRNIFFGLSLTSR